MEFFACFRVSHCEVLLSLSLEFRPAKRPKREKKKKEKKPKERVLVSGSGNLEEAQLIRGIFGTRCMPLPSESHA